LGFNTINVNFKAMKRLFLFILTVPFLITACDREPVADFTASSYEVGVGENVIFTNRSLDSRDFEWDFGDGYYSTDYNVSHYYDETGVYLVQLKAYGKDGVSVASSTIRVYNTYLKITVEEYSEPYYLVPDVSVRLYPTVEDWENETNLVAEGYTDSEGVIWFGENGELWPKRYYVDVYGPNHDNYQLAAEDVAWIETPVLIPGEDNFFTAVVDYYEPEGRSTEKSIILKQNKKASVRTSEPRKATERKK
jgi:hypothetical protein